MKIFKYNEQTRLGIVTLLGINFGLAAKNPTSYLEFLVLVVLGITIWFAVRDSSTEEK